MSKTLTKAWKEGKLEYDWYWVTNNKRGVVPDQYFPNNSWLVSNNFNITEILARCNYDEYSIMQDQIVDLKAELESARWYQTVQNEDIGKLRGLLKECLPIVSAEIMTWQIRGGEESLKRGRNLLTRISSALNEIQDNSGADIKIQEQNNDNR